MGGNKRLAYSLTCLMLTISLTVLLTPVEATNKPESENFSEPVASDRFSAGFADITMQTGGFNQNDYDVRMYYPSGTEGEDTAVDCAWAPYPWLAFHADESEDFDAYNWLGEGLARAGYIVFTVGELRSGDEGRAAVRDHNELYSTVGWMNLSGGDSTTPAGIQGCIDMDHWGVGGHGRGAALSAVVQGRWSMDHSGQLTQPPRALFGLGLDVDDTGHSVVASDLGEPRFAMFLTGTMDEVAPKDDHIVPFVDNWSGGWQLLEVVGANHVQYEDDQSFWDNLFDGEATLSASEQQQHAIDNIRPYLDLTLKGDDASWYSGANRENDPNSPSDSNAYVSEDLAPTQFYRMDTSVAALTGPAARNMHTMFWDSQSNRSVLLGGIDEEGTIFGDYWTFDSTLDHEWTVDSTTSTPPAHFGSAFADNGVDEGLLYGGIDDSENALDTWRWDGYSSTWTNIPAGGTDTPNAVVYSALSHDSAQDSYLLFGGYSQNGTSLNETWNFDFATGVWSNVSSYPTPSGTSSPAMFFSPDWNRTILFGGYGGSSNLISNETWMHNSLTNTWSQLQIAGEHPPARMSAALAIDHASNTAYLFGGLGRGGLLDDLWAFDMAQLSWTELSSGSVQARQGSAMTYDTSLGHLLLFGGFGSDEAFDDTWLFDFNNNTWQLHSVSSAVTVSDMITLSAIVSERDMEDPPSDLQISCKIAASGPQWNWVSGTWDAQNNSAECEISPWSLTPGFHSAILRVSHDGMSARIITSFERANAPPQLRDPIPSFTLIEEGELLLNASGIATDPDGHTLRFVTNSIEFEPLGDDDIAPVLDSSLVNQETALWMQDISDWTNRIADNHFTVCGEIKDEATPGHPPVQVPFCIAVTNQFVDDPLIISEHPIINFNEDNGSVSLDITSLVEDEEGMEIMIGEVANISEYLSVSYLFSTITVDSALNWNGEEQFEACLKTSGSECVWMTILVTVDAQPDPPHFVQTEVHLNEDETMDFPLSDLVWDPDGDELNITLEGSGLNATVELWHEQLRVTPNPDWNGRELNWVLVASDGQSVVRQPMRIIIDPVNDVTQVTWSNPSEISDNITSLRFDITDLDSSGPWTVQYNWDDGGWFELTPSCSMITDTRWECQAELLVHALTYGDHELNLRIDDGEDVSSVKTYWVANPDPNDTGPALADDALVIPPFLWFSLAALFVIGGVIILSALRRQES